MHPASSASDAALLCGRVRLGDFDLTLCSDGTYMLDGGAMFGVVPKPLWSQRMPADDQNRVLLGLNSLIVRAGSSVVVIETGVGNKENEKMHAIHGSQQLLPQSFQAAGISKTDVTHVINTHLHFDHCGWNTTLHDDGTVTPTFPNARYFAAAGEVDHGRRQFDRDKVSYLAANYEPVIASGQMTLVDVDNAGGFAGSGVAGCEVTRSAEIVPGVWMEHFPGHTAHMLAVHIESGSEHACFIGDLLPTHAHLDPTWVMGFDLDPLRCIAERKRFLAQAIEAQWTVIFPHDHALPAARLRWNEKGKPVAEPIRALTPGL